MVLSFPFSDLSQTKRRPALILASLQGDDVILCQITSQAKSAEYSVPLERDDFVSGGLSRNSRIRPNRLFTADAGIIIYSAGRVSEDKLRETIDAVVAILRS